MDREINIDSIRALEEKIREHEEAVIKLKRTRNSLLNISRIPPEVLGDIFRRNTAFEEEKGEDGDFDGLYEGSHNFLLVCHHWFEVALRTPEVWSFWGNTLEDWARWYRYSETAPLDLVLGEDYDSDHGFLNTTLRDVLQHRATQSTIRRVHLSAIDSDLLNSVIALITANSEELRSSRIESFVLWNHGDVVVDLSDLFAHHRFPELRRLELANCAVSSWDRLASRTSVLTALDLDPGHPPAPTTSQLHSLLASNPALQTVRLAITDDGGKSSIQVQLHDLKELDLRGNLRGIFGLLRQLDHPRNLKRLALGLRDCDAADIPQTIGPYLRDHLQRRDRPQNGLDLSLSWFPTHQARNITLCAGDAKKSGFSSVPARIFVNIAIQLSNSPRSDVVERATLDLITCTSREEVVYFRCHRHYPNEDPVAIGNIYTQFPNTRALSFGDVDRGDWNSLINFLARRVSSGNPLDTLVIGDSPHMCLGTMEEVRDMVRELKVDCFTTSCPFGVCPEPQTVLGSLSCGNPVCGAHGPSVSHLDFPPITQSDRTFVDQPPKLFC